MSSELHINIDHFATIRNARKTIEPNLIDVIALLEGCAVHGITTHLREDRRHINDQDIKDIDAYLRNSRLGFTFEMGATTEIREILLGTSAKLATIVPEKREELTTEGGLDLVVQEKYLQDFIKPIQEQGIKVSFFVDPIQEQIDIAAKLGAEFIEIHTGTYANLFIQYHQDLAKMGAFYELENLDAITSEQVASPIKNEIMRIQKAVIYAHELDLQTNLGHGLTVVNLPALLSELDDIKELHIGHSLVANSVFFGLEKLVGFYSNALDPRKLSNMASEAKCSG